MDLSFQILTRLSIIKRASEMKVMKRERGELLEKAEPVHLLLEPSQLEKRSKMACRSSSTRRVIQSANSISIHNSIPTSSFAALRISNSSSSFPSSSSSSSSSISCRSLSSSSTSKLATPTSQPPTATSSTETETDPSTTSIAQWTPNSLRVGLIARKQGMTSYFRSDTGAHVPATVLQVDSNQISAHIGFDQEESTLGQKGIKEKERYYALQVAATDSQKVTRQIKGHLRKAGIGGPGKQVIREFRVSKNAKVPLGE